MCSPISYTTYELHFDVSSSLDLWYKRHAGTLINCFVEKADWGLVGGFEHKIFDSSIITPRLNCLFQRKQAGDNCFERATKTTKKLTNGNNGTKQAVEYSERSESCFSSWVYRSAVRCSSDCGMRCACPCSNKKTCLANAEIGRCVLLRVSLCADSFVWTGRLDKYEIVCASAKMFERSRYRNSNLLLYRCNYTQKTKATIIIQGLNTYELQRLFACSEHWYELLLVVMISVFLLLFFLLIGQIHSSIACPNCQASWIWWPGKQYNVYNLEYLADFWSLQLHRIPLISETISFRGAVWCNPHINLAIC